MLNRLEGEIMNAVYALCQGSSMSILSPAEILQCLPAKQKLSEETLEKILSALALDDYFDWNVCQRKGEKTYVICMHANGYAFKRCNQQRKRETTMRIFWAVVSAVIAFLVGWILKWIF